MLKKTLALCLAVVMIVLTGCQTTLEEPPVEEVPEIIPIDDVIASSVLQYPANDDLFYYNVYDDYIAITKYLGDEVLIKKEDGFTQPTSVTIPDMIDGLPVYVIGPSAFEGCTLESVIISKNVVNIGEAAFHNCPNLKTVSFADVKEKNDKIAQGNGVVTLGASAFGNCVNLESITLPDSIEILGESAFSGCKKLSKINVPVLITEIPSNFCSGCIEMKEIYITDSVVSIEDSAFSNVARDARIYGGVYSQSAHYAANHFMLFVINREKQEIKVEKPGSAEASAENIKKEEGSVNDGNEGASNES